MNKLYNFKKIKVKNGVVKPIENFEDFPDIIDVFKEPPYGEPLTMKDKIDEYVGYLEKGLALGYYNKNEEIMGYIGLMAEVEEEHKPYFNPLITNLNPLYIYGLATKKQFRNHGICSTLIDIVNKMAESYGIDFIYLRINNEESMSEQLSRNLGYTDLYNNGEIAIQLMPQDSNKVSKNTLASANLRRFLIKPITYNAAQILINSESIKEEQANLLLSQKH